MTSLIEAIEAIESVQAISPIHSANVSVPEKFVASGIAPGQVVTQAQLNVSILQASVDVSINAGNEPLALLLQSAIAGINDILEPAFGKNAIQNAASQDNTPEGTAERIVSLSTGFYEAFKQQHLGEPEAEILKQFMVTIRGGFEQGYQEARDILQGMNVLEGDIASNIDKTYTLVLQGYADFAASHRHEQPPSAETPQDSNLSIQGSTSTVSEAANRVSRPTTPPS
jgi:hypothetical protein